MKKVVISIEIRYKNSFAIDFYNSWIRNVNRYEHKVSQIKAYLIINSDIS